MRPLALVTVAALAGCSLPAPESPEEANARRTADCRSAGFAPEAAEFRLCLLLQQTNERLAVLDRRLRRIEQDVQFSGAYGYRRGWW